MEIKIEYKKIDDLIPYDKNPRDNAQAVDMVMESIKEFGFKNPIIIDKNNVIVAGHTRLLAAKKLNFTVVPTIKAKDLTDKQIKAFRIADNRTAEFAEWDEELLRAELSEVDGFTGFSVDEIKELSFKNVGYKEKEPKDKETMLCIKFEDVEDVRKVEEELRKVFDKFDKIRVSIASGEI